MGVFWRGKYRRHDATQAVLTARADEAIDGSHNRRVGGISVGRVAGHHNLEAPEVTVEQQDQSHVGVLLQVGVSLRPVHEMATLT